MTDNLNQFTGGMLWKIRRRVLVLFSFPVAGNSSCWQQVASVQTTGKNIHDIQVTAAELSRMAHLAVDVRNRIPEQHSEGVRVSDLLAKAGVAAGRKQLDVQNGSLSVSRLILKMTARLCHRRVTSVSVKDFPGSVQ